MNEFTSLWDDATRDVEAEQALRSLTSSRIKAASLWPFLAAAVDDDDFSNRLALVEAGIQEAAAYGGISPDALAASFTADFATLALSRQAVFYVKDGDKKVGGPYDDKESAQKAIDGGDVEGESLTVSSEGGDSGESDDDSDRNEDNDDDSEEEKSEGEGDDSGADDTDGGNPFAKKDASKVAFNDAEESQASSERATQMAGEHHDHEAEDDEYEGHDYADDDQDPHYGRDAHWASKTAMPSRVIVPARDGYDDMHKGTWGDLQPGDRMIGLDGATVVHTGPSDRSPVSGVPLHHVRTNHPEWGDQDHHNYAHEPSPGPDGDGGVSFYRKSSAKTASHEPIGYTYEADVHCPDCAEARHGRSARGFIGEDKHDGEGNPVGVIAPWDETHPHGEHCGTCGERIAEPYDHNPDHCGVDMCSGTVKDGRVLQYPGPRHHHSSLFPVIALEDGVDPLAWVVEMAPEGEGEPEKPNSHTTQFTQATMLDRFAAVLHARVPE